MPTEDGPSKHREGHTSEGAPDLPAFSIAGRKVLVTGAARGIGRATALSLAREGAHVVAVDRDGEELGDVAERLYDLDKRSSTITCDLAAVDRTRTLCEDAAGRLGGLDGLAHVAGVILRRDDIDDITEADFDLQYAVNLKATFFLDREAARLMEPGGAIVNLTSQGWWTGGFGGSVAYSATKGGVVSLTRGLSRGFAERGIRINAVAPSAVGTRMILDQSPEAIEDFVSTIPIGRMAESAEIANVIQFLLSDAASYITGATLNVTGGQLSY